MQSNQTSIIRRELATSAVLRLQPRLSDRAIVEQAAQALFEFVFSVCDRLDGKHRWNECDEETKEGFRAEAAVVVETVYPLLSPQPVRRPARVSRMRPAANNNASTVARPKVFMRVMSSFVFNLSDKRHGAYRRP